MNLFIAFCFSLFTLSSFAYGGVINTKKLRADLRITKNYNKAFELSQRGYINKKLTRSLLKDLKKSKLLAHYSIWPKRLLAIESQKKLHKIKNYCKIIIDANYTNPTVDYLNKSTRAICFNRYLKILSSYQSNGNINHKKEVVYFKKHLKYILVNSNRDELRYYLDEFKNNDHNKNKYSEEIISYFIENKLNPSKKLLPSLTFTNRLTKYLQANSYEKRDVRNVLFLQLRELASKVLTSIDKNESESVQKKKFDDVFSFFDSTENLLPQARSYKRLLLLGKSFYRRNKVNFAQETYKRILKPDNYYYSEVVHQYLWTYIDRNKYNEGLLSVYTPYIELNKELKKDSKLQFWIAYSFLKVNKVKLAEERFSKLIKSNPLSYYSILAAKLINKNEEKKGYFKLISDSTEKDLKRGPSNISDQKNLQRIYLWAFVDNSNFLKLELDLYYQSQKRSQKELVKLAQVLSDAKDYLSSFKVIYRGINNKQIVLNENILNILFPSFYLKSIRNKMKRRGFDPLIALSLIRQESGFNKNAISHVGARGLMQLMPNTAKQFKKRISARDLYKPKLNISIGTTYFKNLLSRYDNNLVFSLSAYNAGEGRVDKWQNEYLTSNSILHNIENIPFKETEKYVKLIFRNIFFYKMLHQTDKKDSLAFNQIYDVHLGFNK